MRPWWIVVLLLVLASCLGRRADVPPPAEPGSSGVPPESGGTVHAPGLSNDLPPIPAPGFPIGGEVRNRRGHVIEAVSARVLDGGGSPARIELDVSGYQSDGCLEPVHVDQWRDGNTVGVSIYRVLPPDVACTQMIVAYQATIALDGTFERGTYTIVVNGFSVTVTV